jgi:peroxiredoxin
VGFRLMIVAATVLAVAMGAIGWFAGPGRDTLGSHPAASAPSHEAMTLYSRGKRPVVPDVSGATLTGGKISLRDLRGHVVVLNVWASWCYPCQSEAPDLARLARTTRGQGVRLVGIDTRDTSGAARAFVRKYGLPYPSIYDPNGEVVRELHGLVPVDGVPSTLVIDATGRVAARKIGLVDGAALRKAVRAVVTEQGRS